MDNLTLAQQFSLIGLNGQDSLYQTVVKKATLRCVAAAVVLEAWLEGVFVWDREWFMIDPLSIDSFCEEPYRSLVMKTLLPKGKNKDLSWWIRKVSGLSKRKMTQLEKAITDPLRKQGLIEEIPGLLGCDLYLHSSGVEIKEYRSDSQSFLTITESVRAEVLEEGTIPDEAICMLWLLRESGCMHDLFSRNEIETAGEKMGALYRGNPLAKQLYMLRVRRGIEMAYKQFLKFKSRAVRTQTGSGINFLFPALERSQSVFIEMEAWFSNPERRLRDIKNRLESQGHKFTILREGQIPLIQIDNVVYEAIPHVIYGRVPIHGVRLLPRRPF
ncbi:hypothetical protein [Paenibacillus physcomitrellae]|uniref:Uncharacterized protein n=1 Tax=Paenibacillus physcomitrellae TaxID=1619311 RepID=A0ABQ1GRK2_9BACL|nr:hypothetical protein [Paenibacillus physcomitrellae]GGA48877.1 hypothetical protein GCM10010917_37700 [Paenibacillus physcomitrellae]